MAEVEPNHPPDTEDAPGHSARRWRPLALCGALLALAGWTACRRACQSRLDAELVAAVRDGAAPRARALLAEGADPNARPPARAAAAWQRILDALLGRRRSGGDPVLLTAARHRDWPLVGELVRRGADPNVRGHDGFYVLNGAAFDGQDGVLRLLLDHGADVHVRGARRETPLAAAVTSPSAHAPECVQLLLARGADPRRDVPVYPCVAALAFDKRPDARALELVLRRGADANEPNPWFGSPLGVAIAANNTEVARVLLRCGADPTGPVRGPASARWEGVNARSPALLRLLRQARADWRRKHPPAGERIR